MSTLKLAGLVAGLVMAVGLAATNPTMDGYVRFVEARLAAEIDKMDQSALASRSGTHSEESFAPRAASWSRDWCVRKTTRSNWGLLSLFETNVLEESVLVLGVAGQFIPLRGVEEATLKVGRLAF